MLLPKSLAKGMQNDWFDDQDEEFGCSKTRIWTGMFWEGVSESSRRYGSDIELKKQSGTLRRRITGSSTPL